jgi:glucose-1-phosphate thymidylyltransferase
MKILVFGSKGWIGRRMLAAWPEAVGTDVRIDDKAAVLAELERIKPDAVINTAGRTGKPNVDWCETHPVETAHDNVIGALTLAEACQEKNIYLLHIGSGCVFYGDLPRPEGWSEDDFANPSALYSRTKYAADLVLSKLPNVAIARIRMPIDWQPGSRNLIDKLASYRQVIDVENSVTVIEDFLHAVWQLIQKRGTGIFHVVNPGIMRHRDLLAMYREYVDPNHSCEWIRDEDLVARGLATKQRSNNILQSIRLRELGIEMRPIDVALRDTMIRYAQEWRRTQSHQNLPSFLKSTEPMPSPLPNVRSKQMKGVILAGGKGSRLAPLTNVTNKHLLPVANKQMVLYPLQTLLDAGIRNILLITGPDFAGDFMNLLGSGISRGCHITYRIQDEAGGIAHALGMAEDFVDGDNVTVILGDNIYEDNFLPHVAGFQSGGMVFYKSVPDAQRFGVAEVDAWGHVLSIEEKPKQPKSNFAVTGLYIYDATVFDIIRSLKPSGRGELEITDVNNAFLAQRKLNAKPVKGFWSDAGTFPSLKRASDYFSSREGIG